MRDFAYLREPFKLVAGGWRLAAGSCILAALAACDGGENVTVVAPPPSRQLTDTGITASHCYAAGSDALVSCTSAGALALNNAQDGMRGRDVTHPDPTEGKLGFNFSTVGSYAKTECVKDNLTGLIWEGKTADGGLRDWNKVYTNYDDTTAAQYDSNSGYVPPTQAQIDAATNTVGYKNAVNATALCGYTDWRLPTADELQSLVDYGVAAPGPTIDAVWFPNTQGYVYWSSSPYVAIADFAAFAWFVVFADGLVTKGGRNVGFYVRLVRAGQ